MLKKNQKASGLVFVVIYDQGGSIMYWLEWQGMANLGVRYSNQEVNLFYF